MVIICAFVIYGKKKSLTVEIVRDWDLSVILNLTSAPAISRTSLFPVPVKYGVFWGGSMNMSLAAPASSRLASTSYWWMWTLRNVW